MITKCEHINITSIDVCIAYFSRCLPFCVHFLRSDGFARRVNVYLLYNFQLCTIDRCCYRQSLAQANNKKTATASSFNDASCIQCKVFYLFFPSRFGNWVSGIVICTQYCANFVLRASTSYFFRHRIDTTMMVSANANGNLCAEFYRMKQPFLFFRSDFLEEKKRSK